MSLTLAQLSKVLRQVSRAGSLIIALSLSFSAYAADTASFKVGQALTDAQAIQEWTPLARQGDSAAQFRLGVMYYNGQGVTQDYEQAFKWFSLTADQGYSYAQHYLGWMHHRGEGVKKDYKQAVKWYTLAADQGDALSRGYLKELLEGKITDWNLEDKEARIELVDIDDSITTYVSAFVTFSAGGSRKQYFEIWYDKLQCEITKDLEKPSTNIWHFNNQAVKMNAWCKKYSNSDNHYLQLTPQSYKGSKFVVSAFRKAPSTVAIKTNSLSFKMSAKGFTKVWNSVSSEAL